mmetsp:Transcript_35665/g.33809  ORF Transcript_35665/g.33809 Transcript_35665/m.33809 type:complete len:498 (-) Transcript_35665:236-1729(-)|eukprot:CAMPEP_0119036616 /NCGR_PEP_ID=MMETSP1177-20130426/4443_1 /TAXON_ID=2985 /ORGANISM="Ochromonas sp, Strain CCMP1899" /LENGTH=497 /DNA_ID=CAMNT_0006996753 /DNA_START=95 /DNA_END=1588 /DNA_ORIENTATION=+
MEGRYRTVSSGMNSVDESLFGTGSRKPSASKTYKNTKMLTGPPVSAPETVVISQRELNCIKQNSTIKSQLQMENDRLVFQEEKEERAKVANDRKHRMRELEKTAMLNTKKSDSDMIKLGRDQATRETAQEKVDSSSDVIKMLTSMSVRAAAFTVRDKQLEEKKEREKVEEDYERRMDLLMELDRIREIQRREEVEDHKYGRRLADRKVITDQIEMRTRDKLAAQEAKEQENLAMLSMMKGYSNDDERKAAKRQTDNESSRLEVIEANKEQTERKNRAKEALKREAEDMLRYQAGEDARLTRIDAEASALTRLKNERLARLLADSERSQSSAGKADEIRARRAAEERERRARDKERDDAIKKKSDTMELVMSRKEQALDKSKREQRAKERHEEEYRQELQHLADQADKEEQEQRNKGEATTYYRDMLMAQIEAAQLKKKSTRSGHTDEGADHRLAMVKEEARLGGVRDKMVEEMQAKGVSNRYLSEMRAVDIGKVLRR